MTGHKTEKLKEFESRTLAHMDRLHRFGVHLTGNTVDADDLVQETYLKAFRYWETCDLDYECSGLAVPDPQELPSSISTGRRFARVLLWNMLRWQLPSEGLIRPPQGRSWTIPCSPTSWMMTSRVPWRNCPTVVEPF